MACYRFAKRKKYHTITVIVSLIIAIFATVAIGSALFWKRATPKIEEIAQVNVRSLAVSAVNEAVLSIADDGIGYGDLVSVEKNSLNEVTFIAANSALINKLAYGAAIEAQAKLASLQTTGIAVPLGNVSGIALLAEKGPVLRFDVKPLSAVQCNFHSEFISAGFNQTVHRIYLRLSVSVEVVLPTESFGVDYSVPMLVAESVIVGAVPSVLMQNTELGGFSLK